MAFDKQAYLLELDTIQCHLSCDPSIDWEETRRIISIDKIGYVEEKLSPELSMQFVPKESESLALFTVKIPPPDVIAHASEAGLEGGGMAYFLGERCLEKAEQLFSDEADHKIKWEAVGSKERVIGHKRWNKKIDGQLKKLLTENGIKELGWLVYIQAQGEGENF